MCRGDWGRVGHKIYFDLYETHQQAYQVCNWPVLNLYVHGLYKLTKVHKILSSFCATNMENSSKNMTHSTQVREEWTTELEGVGQEVWAEVMVATVFTCNYL